MARVYLETSFFSACVSDRTDAASVYRREQSRQWWARQRERHQLLISPEVLTELSNPVFPLADLAMKMTVEIEILPLTQEVRGVAKILVGEKVMPGPEESGDAVHVAAAIVHRVEYVLSWNVRHLANMNKLEHLRIICQRLGYMPPMITTPEVVWGT
ncbi:MAG: type II toxin-antitoxin system VapC family toxin [Phycisphaerae bacterium]|nr:type II toxin-antitoxin system VapC family toxin [Phycisphaerae bacterium]